MKYTKKSYRSKIGYILTWKSMGNFSFSFFISSIGYTKIYQILSMFFMCISYDDCHFWHIIVVISNLPFLAYHRCRRVKMMKMQIKVLLEKSPLNLTEKESNMFSIRNRAKRTVHFKHIKPPTLKKILAWGFNTNFNYYYHLVNHIKKSLEYIFML